MPPTDAEKRAARRAARRTDAEEQPDATPAPAEVAASVQDTSDLEARIANLEEHMVLVTARCDALAGELVELTAANSREDEPTQPTTPLAPVPAETPPG